MADFSQWLSDILEGRQVDPGEAHGLSSGEQKLLKKISVLKSSCEHSRRRSELFSETLNELKIDFQKAVNIISVFKRFSGILNKNVNPADIRRMVIEIFIDSFSFDQCSIMLLNPETGNLELSAGLGQNDYFHGKDEWGEVSFSLKPGVGVAGIAAQDRKPVVVNDISKDERFVLKDEKPALGSLASFPITYQDKLIGVLNFSHPETNFFSDNFIRTLSPASNMIGQILEFAATHEKLEEMNRTLEEKISEKTSELLISKQQMEIANDELKEVNCLKDDFMANLSHEIRTPLTSIIGFARLMLDYPDMKGSEQKAYLEIISEAGHALETLINNLMDISCIESNNLMVNIENINMNEIIIRCVEKFKPMIDEKGQTLLTRLDNQPQKIYGDSLKLKQVISNLLHNAIKFTGKGGTINVLCKGLPQEVMVSIIDNGIGVEEDRQQIIFERFKRAGDGSQSGVGIGLNLARLLVELHGGRIWLESKPRSGSNFSFCIPRKILCELEKQRTIEPLFT